MSSLCVVVLLVVVLVVVMCCFHFALFCLFVLPSLCCRSMFVGGCSWCGHCQYRSAFLLLVVTVALSFGVPQLFCSSVRDSSLS